MSDFDSYAHDYEVALNKGLAISGEDRTFFARKRLEWLAACLRKAGLVAPAVMDFGCGTGAATPYFFELLQARSVVGVDLSSRSLDIARQKYAGSAVEYRVISDYQPAGQLDLVFCNGVLHHVPLAERRQTIEYMAHSLRPGGYLALWENNPWNPGTRYVMSRIPFDTDAIRLWPMQTRRLVHSIGLEVSRTDFCFIFPHMLRALRVLEKSLCRLPLGAQYQVLARKACR